MISHPILFEILASKQLVLIQFCLNVTYPCKNYCKRIQIASKVFICSLMACFGLHKENIYAMEYLFGMEMMTGRCAPQGKIVLSKRITGIMTTIINVVQYTLVHIMSFLFLLSIFFSAVACKIATRTTENPCSHILPLFIF